MIFSEIKPGDTFKVDYKFEEEWFLRGDWMRTERDNLCVCLTQGRFNQGDLKSWIDDHPVKMVKKRHLP
jgi:hypothetical protein